MRNKSLSVDYCFQKAKQCLKADNQELARYYADLGILQIAIFRNKGYKDEDLVEGNKVELWLERFWIFLEKNGLML
jgi:hypothetical protein